MVVDPQDVLRGRSGGLGDLDNVEHRENVQQCRGAQRQRLRDAHPDQFGGPTVQAATLGPLEHLGDEGGVVLDGLTEPLDVSGDVNGARSVGQEPADGAVEQPAELQGENRLGLGRQGRVEGLDRTHERGQVEYLAADDESPRDLLG